MEIRLADDKGRERFESVVAKGDEIMYLSVNRETAGFTKIELKEPPPWMLSWKMSDDVRTLEQAKIPVGSAERVEIPLETALSAKARELKAAGRSRLEICRKAANNRR